MARRGPCGIIGALDWRGTEGARAAGEIGRGATIGRYTILAPAGGGASRVYAAYDPELDRRVTLVLLAADDDEGGRVLGNAQALAKLSHPNVVAVHDVGTFEGLVFLTVAPGDGVTAEAWLAERPRATKEILAVFTDAARGLGAAHAAGLVHGAFDASAVRIDKDGAARVGGFGLSGADRGVGDLAPEQLAGGPFDARADQFSFCAALARALTGDRSPGVDLAGRVEAAVPKAAPRRALLRGLARDPAARWPSMLELVDALGRDPARARHRWGAAAGVAMLMTLAAVTLARRHERSASLCLAGPARLGGIWETGGAARPRRDAVERAFVATAAPGARDAFQRAAAALDAYAAGWLAMYRDACEATHGRGDQPASLLDLRMACLDERRHALSALVDVLGAADRDVVGRAVSAANALPLLERCADREQLESPVAPPADAATRARVEDLRRRAASAKALNDAGKHAEARALARAQLAEARALGYRPLVAEALVTLGRTFAAFDAHQEAIALYAEAVWTSLAVGRDDLGAEAAVELSAWVGVYLRRFDESRTWSHLARALLDRAAGDNRLTRSWLLTNECYVANVAGEPQRALPLCEEAVALKAAVLPPGHPDIANTLNNEAESLALVGRTAEALRVNQRLSDVYAATYGARSSEMAVALGNRGEYSLALGRPADALAPLADAIAIWEEQAGLDAVALAYPLTDLGRALIALSRAGDAVPPLERALSIRRRAGSDAAFVAETSFVLARALWDAGRDRPRARTLAEEARAAAGDDKARREIDAWLAGHPAR